MNNAELDRFMAEEVMGWRENNLGMWMTKDTDRFMFYAPSGYMMDNDNGWSITRNKAIDATEIWHPTTSIEQAMMCVEKWANDKEGTVFIEYSRHTYQVALMRKGYTGISGQDTKLELAICHAIYESRGE